MPQRSHALVAAGVGLVAAVLGGAWLRAQQEPQNPVAATAKATDLPPSSPSSSLPKANAACASCPSREDCRTRGDWRFFQTGAPCS